MRGLISIELMLILITAMYFIATVNKGVTVAGFTFAEDFDKLSAARAAVDKIQSAAHFVAAGGPGSQAKISIYVPENVTISWNGNTVEATITTQLPYNGSNTQTITKMLPLNLTANGSVSGPGWNVLAIAKVGTEIRIQVV